MKRAVKGENLAAARDKRGQFHGVLVGFGSGVAQEERIVVITALAAEFLGHAHLQTVFYGIGIEAETTHLVAHSFDICGMGVSDGYDGMASIKVEIAGAVGREHV